MAIPPSLPSLLDTRLPMIMAPMFLVSNKAMMQAAIRSGIMGCFPSLNFRGEGELENLIRDLHATEGTGNFGVNLIVQKSNPLYLKHLDICVAGKVPFFITSLGNPKEVIEAAHGYGAKVFCDVTNMMHAQKVADQGCDGFIAVASGAGGHAGPNAIHVLVEGLRKRFPDIPVVAAGGIATGRSLAAVQLLGASGASIGTRFIACQEAEVNQDYKHAVCDYGMDDIIMTEKISGTPCAVINTPYAQKLGTKQNFIERLLSKNRTIRKYFKMLVQYRGMKKLQRAVQPGTYNTLWSAGQSVEMIDEVLSVEKIVGKITKEYHEAAAEFSLVAQDFGQ